MKGWFENLPWCCSENRNGFKTMLDKIEVITRNCTII